MVGGRLLPGSVPRIKYEINNYQKYLEKKLREAVAGGNVTLHFHHEVNAEELKSLGYDSLVFALGTLTAAPKLPGMEKVKTVQAVDLLSHPELLGDAKKIVVVGGGVVGCETAYWLKYEKGRDVAVIEMLPYIMKGTCTANRGHLIYYLRKAGVQLINCAKVTGFDTNLVKISRNVSKGVPDPYNTWQPILPENIENPLAPKIGGQEKAEELPADLVVLALGGRPDDSLYYQAQEIRAADELFNIGDSFSAGKVLEATRAAQTLAYSI